MSNTLPYGALPPSNFAVSEPSEKWKMPKQWKHWCKLAGLKVSGYKGKNRFHRHQSSWIGDLEGRGRRFRVSCLGTLDVSCCNENFDRWALSHVAGLPIPKTQDEFLATISTLTNLSRADQKSQFNHFYEEFNEARRKQMIDDKKKKKMREAAFAEEKRFSRNMAGLGYTEVWCKHPEIDGYSVRCYGIRK